MTDLVPYLSSESDLIDSEYFYDVISWAERNENFVDSDTESVDSKGRNLDAYEELLRKRLSYRSKPAILRVSVNLFDETLDNDPDFLLSYSPRQECFDQPKDIKQLNFSFPDLNELQRLEVEAPIKTASTAEPIEGTSPASTTFSYRYSIDKATIDTSISEEDTKSLAKSRRLLKSSRLLKMKSFAQSFVSNNIRAAPAIEDYSYLARERESCSIKLRRPHAPALPAIKLIKEEEELSKKVTIKSSIANFDNHIASRSQSGFYLLLANLYTGEEFSFEQLRGKVVLIVNVATYCGLSFQLRKFYKLVEKYGSERLSVVVFMSNDFKQEPRNNELAGRKCSTLLKVPLPVMEKVHVRGKNTHPVYQYLKNCKAPEWLHKLSVNQGNYGVSKDGRFNKRLLWNFEKFLVDANGQVIKRFHPLVMPSALDKHVAELM